MIVMRLVLVMLVTLAACSNDANTDAGPTPEEIDARTLVVALCRARFEAVYVEESRSIFMNEAHDPLHELAARVQEIDAGVAGHLLEAKQLVEASLEDKTLEDELGERLAELIDATRAALSVLDPSRTQPNCPGS